MAPSRSGRRWISLASLLGVACGSPVPERPGSLAPGGAPTAPAGPESGAVDVSFFPPSAADAVARVVRAELHFAEPLGATRVMLASGTVTPAQLRELGRGAISQALAAREIGAVAWTAREDPSTLLVAPLRVLEPGAAYTIAVASPPTAVAFQVAADDARPLLPRTWPRADDDEASADFALWCGGSGVGSLDRTVALDPSQRMGRLRAGKDPLSSPSGCVAWRALAPSSGSPAPPAPDLPPIDVTFDDGAVVALEPAPIHGSGTAPGAGALDCTAGEIPLAAACVEVQDDRLIVRPPDGALLFSIDAGFGPQLVVSEAGRPFVVRPIPAPGGMMRVVTIDRLGDTQEAEVTVEAAPPRARLVLNEVYANPLGREPDQEWVELVNDGASAVDLAGYRIEDAGGSALLPAAELAPGAFALIVADGFVADDGIDPVPASTAVVVRVLSLGKGGLSNEGEPLALRAPHGDVVSRFPPLKSKGGTSVARLAPDALDDDPASFAASPNGSATPGAPNVSARE